jgi:hypothetical protein
LIRLNKTEIQLRRLTATFTIDANKWQYPLNRNSGLHIHCEINIVVTIRERNLKNGRIARDIWSTAIAGTVAAPLMIVIILLAAEKSVMGEFTPGPSPWCLFGSRSRLPCGRFIPSWAKSSRR